MYDPNQRRDYYPHWNTRAPAAIGPDGGPVGVKPQIGPNPTAPPPVVIGPPGTVPAGPPNDVPPGDPVDLTTVRPGPVGPTPQQQALLDQYMANRRQSALTRRWAQINAANPLLQQARPDTAGLADAPPALDGAVGRNPTNGAVNIGEASALPPIGPSSGSAGFSTNAPRQGATSGSFGKPGMSNSQNQLFGWLNRGAVAGSGKPSVGPATSAPSPQGPSATNPRPPQQPRPRGDLPGSRYF